MPTNKDYLSRREAAQYLSERGIPIKPGTLAQRAHYGNGPRFYRFGNRVLYTPADLDHWLSERLGNPVRSTSEVAS